MPLTQHQKATDAVRIGAREAASKLKAFRKHVLKPLSEVELTDANYYNRCVDIFKETKGAREPKKSEQDNIEEVFIGAKVDREPKNPDQARLDEELIKI